jgi:hypothetical protein
MRPRLLIGFCFIGLLAIPLSAFDDLNQDQVNLLKDSGGWEYTKLSDDSSGVPLEHTCFDGAPHPDQCRGSLTLDREDKFVQQVVIEGKAVDRHGSYKLDSDQLAFFDEFGTRDGPYTVEIDPVKKTMVLSMPQIRMELTLESEYHKKKNNKK